MDLFARLPCLVTFLLVYGVGCDYVILIISLNPMLHWDAACVLLFCFVLSWPGLVWVLWRLVVLVGFVLDFGNGCGWCFCVFVRLCGFVCFVLQD